MGLSPMLPNRNELGDPLGRVNELGAALPPSPDSPQLASGLQPLISSARSQQEQGLQGKISNYENPQKPQGFWQNVRHVAATIGNVAGDIVAPATMSLIPGTQLHNQVQQGRNIKELAGLQNEDRLDQTQAGENSLRNAQTAGELESTAEAPGKAASTEAYQGAEKANAESETTARNEEFANAYSHRVNEVIKAGGDPGTDPMAQSLLKAHNAALPPVKPVNAEHVTLTGPKGSPISANYHPDTGQYADAAGNVITNPSPYEKPNVTNINAGDKEAAALKKQVYTAYTPVMDSAERFNVMSKNYEDAIKNHDQQAMLSLLYNHMGMTMGLQKGARMTQALILEAQKSQPWLQGIEAKFDKDGYLTGVTLSPRQMQEMVHNAQGRYSEDVGKARNESQYLGSKDDGPARTPNASTVNYYMGMANGDVNKAKQQAAQDGWTIR